MQIKAGKYYRTRGGQVFAPITRGQAAAILAICGAVLALAILGSVI